jgi:ABC-type phosphate transport system auxiliary subunit
MKKLTLKDTQLLLNSVQFQQFQQLQQQLSQLQETLDRSGVIFLDSLGKVQLMTSQAAQWLQSYFPSSNGFSIFLVMVLVYFQNNCTHGLNINWLDLRQ